MLQFEAVNLFVERGRAATRSFTLSEGNAAASVEVCRRLDGIPLAIELAAARLKMLPVEEIAGRLDDRFRLLTGGSRAALPRQQTLRAAIDWSYDLLTEAERVLLRRLSVFEGTFSLEGAEAVCGDEVGSRQYAVGSGEDVPSSLPTAYCLLPTAEVLDLLGQLVEKSLVQVVEARSEAKYRLRYRLLETIRQYGAEKLRGSGEGAPPGATGPSPEEHALRSRHRDCYLTLAEEAEPELQGRGQGEWLARVEAERDNLRAALAWCMEQGDAEAGLRLGGALWRFWMVRGYMTEGREQLTKLLSLPGAEARTVVRGRALHGAGHMYFRQGNYQEARALLEESLVIARELGSFRDILHALGGLGHLERDASEYARCAAYYRECMALRQSREDRFGIAQGLEEFAVLAGRQRQWERAVRLIGAAHGLAQTLGRSLPVIIGIAREAVPEEYQHTVGGARSALGEAAFTAAWEAGRAMSLNEAIDYALGENRET